MSYATHERAPGKPGKRLAPIVRPQPIFCQRAMDAALGQTQTTPPLRVGLVFERRNAARQPAEVFANSSISRSMKNRPRLSVPMILNLSRIDLNRLSSSCCSATYHCRKLNVE